MSPVACSTDLDYFLGSRMSKLIQQLEGFDLHYLLKMGESDVFLQLLDRYRLQACDLLPYLEEIPVSPEEMGGYVRSYNDRLEESIHRYLALRRANLNLVHRRV
ncbi:MAG: hypothetical protein HYU64_17110 [Armatimonadetes bacterium]|nr:hypothetical protein [Armatimonadota bacterium]